MITIQATGASGGVAFGKLAFYSKPSPTDEPADEVMRKAADDPAYELARFEDAKSAAISQLQELYEKALAEVGEERAAIFEIHQMMIDDGDFCDAIKGIVSDEKICAEFAVKTAADDFAAMFASMDDEYMQGRAADVRDISDRLIRNLRGGGAGDRSGAGDGVRSGAGDGVRSGAAGGGVRSGAGIRSMDFSRPIILAADDLAPSETIQLDKDKILAFVTRGGGVNSHTAILARAMNIPALTGAGDRLSEGFDGKFAAVDGHSGKIHIEPDDCTLNRLKAKAADESEQKKRLQTLKGKDNISIDGRRIDIFANIGLPSDADAALENDAGGIGLFRSEFLYLNSSDYPGENEQFEAYKAVAMKMAGKKVVIRTLDIGADKQIGYFDLPKEENPAMGFRAVRICLERPEIFKTQLRAILRASAFGKIAIMFPMIASVEEVKDCKAILDAVMAELDKSGIDYDKDIETGVMIETPAAVIISDLLAREVDFFSVGTNDLTQYTLAVDRQNPKLGRFYNPRHLALIRMLKMAADNAHKEGKWIGVCGELAADLELTETFLAIGIDELSVSPPHILPLRAKVRETDVSKVKQWV